MSPRAPAVRSATLSARGLAAALAAALLAALLVAVPARAETYLLSDDEPLPTGASVVAELPVVEARIVRSEHVPTAAVALDAQVTFRGLSTAPGAPTGVRLDSGVASTRAPAVWDTTRGEDALVALVDTGVAPVDALDGAVAGEIDFSGTGGGDGYGHGTFMASLIAGRGPDVPGVAPGAGILSLKVAGPDGSTDLGRVLSALQWLYGPGRAVGVRVATLALGTEPGTPAAALLDLAVARLAADGVLVVTASGNDGPGTLSSPATSPGAFAVGAVDDRGTADRADDLPADFSSSGVDRGGVAKPDLVASGVDVVGWMDPDAAIATAHPSAVLDDRGLVRGSGTSMSTALAAGVAALAASARGDLDGIDLAAALRAADGQLDAPDTLAAAEAMPARREPPGWARADHPGQGDGNASRGRAEGRDGETLPASVRWRSVRWRDGDWGGDWLERPWESVRWRSVRWRSVRWRDDQWGADEWGSVRWRSVRWRSVRWRDGHWGDADWDVAAWGSVRWRADGGWAGLPYEGEDSVSWEAVRAAPATWAWRAP